MGTGILDLLPARLKPAGRGEFHGPCPSCGGVDRFIVWSDRDKFWCRQCNKSGDAIDLYRLLNPKATFHEHFTKLAPALA